MNGASATADASPQSSDFDLARSHNQAAWRPITMKVSASVIGWPWASFLAGLTAQPAAGRSPARRATGPAGLGHHHRDRQLRRPRDPGQRDGRRQCPESPRAWFRAAGWDDDHQLLMQRLRQRRPGHRDAPAANILPTRNNLNWAIDEWLLPRAEAGDLVVLYFAGQAETVRPPGPGREPRVDHYLLPINAPKADLAGTGWSLDAPSTVRPAADPGGLLAGDGRRRAARPRPARPGARPPADRDRARNGSRRLTRWPGVSAWLASDRSEGRRPARWIPPTPFTSALLAGLGDDETPEEPAGLPEAAAAGFEARAPGIPGDGPGARRD